VWHKEYGSAKGPLERFVAAKKEERGALQLLSRVYFNLGDYEGVVRILNRGELLNPQDSENYYMGASLLELGRFEAAAEFLRIYTAHYKTDWEVFVRLGYARYCAGLYDLAADSYEMAERLNPSAPEIGESIARCRAKLKSRASK
jgi:tetratricopeptide (TPR) repeat protein